jgi:RNA polymerase sigma-70 factor (family 1)
MRTPSVRSGAFSLFYRSNAVHYALTGLITTPLLLNALIFSAMDFVSKFNHIEQPVSTMHVVRDNFDDIFRLYKDRIYRYVLVIVKSTEAAEELTQEILIKLWLCRDLLNKVDNLDGYIYVIARNKALNHLRKAACDLRLMNELKSFMQDEQNNIDDRITANDYDMLVKQALATLSPQRRKVYELSRVEGLNHEEIADRLSLSKNTVKNHMVEALKHIRGHINKSGGAALLLTVYMLS